MHTFLRLHSFPPLPPRPPPLHHHHPSSLTHPVHSAPSQDSAQTFCFVQTLFRRVCKYLRIIPVQQWASCETRPSRTHNSQLIDLWIRQDFQIRYISKFLYVPKKKNNKDAVITNRDTKPANKTCAPSAPHPHPTNQKTISLTAFCEGS